MPNQSGPPRSIDDNHLFINLLTGDNTAASELYPALTPYLKWLAVSRLGYLDTDLSEDIVSETWLEAIKRGPEQFQKSGCKVKSYLSKIMWSAVRAVKAQYGPPGQKTRTNKKNPYDPRKVVSLESLDDGDLRSADESTEKLVALKFLLDKMDDRTREIFTACFIEGKSQREVATEFGVHHSFVDRRISVLKDKYATEIQQISTASGW